MSTLGYLPLTCHVFSDLVGGKLRYRGVVTSEFCVLYEGKWRHSTVDAAADANEAAARITKKRSKFVVN
jgi:hypothetical protein